MAKKFRVVLVAILAIGAIFTLSTGSAFARGQCGGAVSSTEQFYNNLQRMGVTGQAADVMKYAGYSSIDSSFSRWLNERVIITRLEQTAVIDNYGCEAGRLFYAGKKTLSKNWAVAVALPDRYAKSDVATKWRPGYKAVVISARLVGQATCTNPGKAIVRVKIFVKKVEKRGKTVVTVLKKTRGGHGVFTIQWRAGHKKWRTKRVRSGKRYTVAKVRRGTRVSTREIRIPKGWKLVGRKVQTKRAHGRRVNFTIVNKKRAPKRAAPSCEQGARWSDTQQNCVVNDQDQHVEQECRAGEIRQGTQCAVIQNNCGTVVIGNGNVVTGDNCTNNEQNICTANGGSWKNDVCVYPPPKTCEELGTCPKPPASGKCTALVVTPDYITHLKVNAVVTYTAQNATLTGVTYYWGDSSTSTGGVSASHTYDSPGTYSVYAVLTFSTGKGDITDTCTAVTVTPKNSTTTPPPPPEAPGPNPQPSPNDPAPGGHQCFREEDGRPVDPLPDGRCPLGSYGA